MKKIPKSILKTNYYWEYESLYDTLPDKLLPVSFRTEILKENMDYITILKTFNIIPCGSFLEAARIAVSTIDSIKNGEYKIVFFFNSGIPCRLNVWRYDYGKLNLYVNEVSPDFEWFAGRGVLVAINTSETTNQTLELSDTLALAIQTVKEAGYKIFKEL